MGGVTQVSRNAPEERGGLREGKQRGGGRGREITGGGAIEPGFLKKRKKRVLALNLEISVSRLLGWAYKEGVDGNTVRMDVE